MVKVSDEGVGIPNEELEEIFGAFNQSSRTKTGAGGVGLGLNIAMQIVEVHGGKIWAVNNPEGGSSFCFTVPYSMATRDLSRVCGKTILIIDDESFLLESMELNLTSLGAKVITATDGESALEIIAKELKSIDAVVLDVMMPGMGGIETLQCIKAKYPSLKVIMHSGMATDNEKAEALSLGVHSFLAKPYTLEELIKNLYS